jgi:hypothetical protein
VLARIAGDREDQARDRPSPALASGIADRVFGVRGLRARARRRALAAAAAVAVVVVLVLTRGGTRQEATGRREGTAALARQWLARVQEPDGRWSAARWGGDARFDPALTGLGLLAFLDGGAVRPASGVADPAGRAARALIALQGPAGSFGEEFPGTPYNQGIATVAILEFLGSRRAAGGDLEPSVRRSLDWIRARQSRSGGWGYLESPEEPNSALSFWPLQALILGRRLGLLDSTAEIERGFAWLASVSDREGRIGYRRAGELPGPGTLNAMGVFCEALAGNASGIPETLRRRWRDRFHLASAEWRTQGAERGLYGEWLFAASGAARERSSVRGDAKSSSPAGPLERLVRSQVASGDFRGSWQPDDRFSPVGGRVYATATAALALQARARWERIRSWTRES